MIGLFFPLYVYLDLHFLHTFITEVNAISQKVVETTHNKQRKHKEAEMDLMWSLQRLKSWNEIKLLELDVCNISFEYARSRKRVLGRDWEILNIVLYCGVNGRWKCDVTCFFLFLFLFLFYFYLFFSFKETLLGNKFWYEGETYNYTWHHCSSEVVYAMLIHKKILTIFGCWYLEVL